VVDSLAGWLPDNRDKTVAVLVPRNRRGFEVVDALKQNGGLDFIELLRSTTSTREAAGALGNVLRYLSDPGNPALLATVYKVWRRDEREDEEKAARLEAVVKALRGCPFVEDFTQPQLGRDWLDDDETLADLMQADPYLRERLLDFRALVQKWQRAVILPIDQLILILAGDLFTAQADLAIAHSLAVALRRSEANNPHWRLPEFTEELATIARDERRFLGVSDDDLGFDPEAHKGKVTVSTMHRAKGLEWDRVYLLSVSTYDFPSAVGGENFISEKWFLRDNLNLQAEALAQLTAARAGGSYREGEASESARLDYVAERLRLLYVGITRARRELIVTWNTGRKGDQRASDAFVALRTFAEESASDS
jgi:DNA helicase-2/ATP-dependent DNA helicase PcrA